MFQKELLQRLKNVLPTDSSLIESVAIALQISYDAAYRRVSCKSKISIDEAIILARYYDLSIDSLIGTLKNQHLAVEITKSIDSEKEMEAYFKSSYDSLSPLLAQKESTILYSAKDIPIFYTLSGDILSTFKIYVWLKLLNSSFESKNFESFTPNLSLTQAAKKLGGLYQNLKTIEVWDITTINSTLKQIHYYYHAGLVQTDTALRLCDALKNLIDTVHEKLLSKESSYFLYYNELLLMNNHVLVKATNMQAFYVPYTILSYYKTSNKDACKQAEDFLQKQIQSSKLLNTAGEKEQNTFFNKMRNKIDALQQLVRANQVLDFE